MRVRPSQRQQCLRRVGEDAIGFPGMLARREDQRLPRLRDQLPDLGPRALLSDRPDLSGRQATCAAARLPDEPIQFVVGDLADTLGSLFA